MASPSNLALRLGTAAVARRTARFDGFAPLIARRGTLAHPPQMAIRVTFAVAPEIACEIGATPLPTWPKRRSRAW